MAATPASCDELPAVVVVWQGTLIGRRRYLQVERLEKELRVREAKLAEQADLIAALRVEASETGLNAQLAIDELREDLQQSEARLRKSQVILVLLPQPNLQQD
jgi:hypothetical protein